MKLFTILSFSIIILNTACKKSKLESINNVGSIDSLSYQPAVSGSTWKYDNYLSGVKSPGKTTICQNFDTTFNSKIYDVYLNNDGSYNYSRKEVDKYYYVLSTSTNKTELCALDVAKNINETWIGGINGSDTYKYTIKEKLSTLVVNGITLKNVIKVYNERYENSILKDDGYIWYAQGIGNFKTELKINTIPLEIILTAADIK